MKKGFFVIFSILYSIIFSQVKVERFLPDYYIPGEKLTVELKMDVDENNKPNAIIISEKIPNEWTIISSTPNYNKVEDGSYKYLFYPSDNIRDTVIKYEIYVPLTATGIKNFEGFISYIMPDGTIKEDKVIGKNEISLSGQFLQIEPKRLIFVEENLLTLSIKNMGNQNLEWNIVENIPWLFPSKTFGILRPGTLENIQIIIDRTGLLPGTYKGYINLNTTIGNFSIEVILIVETPSPVKKFNCIGIPEGIYLYWENPENYTGTIIFRKIEKDIEKYPENGKYYDILGNPEGYESFLLDGSVCIYKNIIGSSDFIDNVLTDSPVFYNIYSFIDKYYSLPLRGSCVPLKKIYSFSIANNEGGEFFISNTNTNLDSISIKILPNSLSGIITQFFPARINFSIISPSQAPSHPGLVGFANIYSFKTENFNLQPDKYILIRIPIYDTDISASGVTGIEKLKVYYWNEINKNWKEAKIVKVEKEPVSNRGIIGFLTIKLEEVGKINYISTGFPILVPEEGGGGCFIATACFGSPISEEVIILRKFRDKILLRNKMGRAFVRWYYKHSPKYAEIIKNKNFLKKVVRVSLKPFVWFAKLIVSSNS